MRTSILYILLLLSFTFYNAYSQKHVNVITKSIVKEFEYSGETFVIQGEKSNINIQRWNAKKIKIEIKLIAKNPIESKAKRDLDVMHYSFQNDNRFIRVNNYFKSNEITDITSNLSIEYSIYIPNKCNIQLINLYGSVSISNIETSGNINNSFGSVVLNNIIGSLTVDLHFADLNVNGLSGLVTIKTKNSDIQLHKISGDYKLNATYGSIEITSTEKLNNLTINAQRTSVSIIIRKFEDFNYSLSTQNDKIIVPSEYTKLIKEEAGLLKFNKASGSENKSIKINTTYCPITLKTE